MFLTLSPELYPILIAVLVIFIPVVILTIVVFIKLIVKYAKSQKMTPLQEKEMFISFFGGNYNIKSIKVVEDGIKVEVNKNDVVLQSLICKKAKCNCINNNNEYYLQSNKLRDLFK